MKKRTTPLMSMTGFGEAAFTDGQSLYRLYLSSVNHRFLDLSAKLPESTFFLEAEFKKSARSVMKRGRVSLVVEKYPENAESEISIDKKAAGKYVKSIRELASAFGLNDKIEPASLLSLPGVVSASLKRSPGEKVKREASKALKEALGALLSMRTAEGTNIGKAIQRSVETLSRHSASLPRTAESSRKRRMEVLKKKVKEAGPDPSEAGFASEITNLVNRLDITEEIDRITSHISQFKGVLAGNPSGVKLDFILQELLRETNTIAAKSQDISISQKTIEMKTELQKLKEQVQNIE